MHINDISYEDFESYVGLQISGERDMTDVMKVSELTDLPREKVQFIINHYELLMEKYPEVVN